MNEFCHTHTVFAPARLEKEGKGTRWVRSCKGQGRRGESRSSCQHSIKAAEGDGRLGPLPRTLPSAQLLLPAASIPGPAGSSEGWHEHQPPSAEGGPSLRPPLSGLGQSLSTHPLPVLQPASQPAHILPARRTGGTSRQDRRAAFSLARPPALLPFSAVGSASHRPPRSRRLTSKRGRPKARAASKGRRGGTPAQNGGKRLTPGVGKEKEPRRGFRRQQRQQPERPKESFCSPRPERRRRRRPRPDCGCQAASPITVQQSCSSGPGGAWAG